jgi:hypothetical protein
MKRKILIFALVMICFIQTGALAANPPEAERSEPIILRYEQMESASPGLSVTGKVASYSLSAKGNKDVTSISASLQLQKKVNGSYQNYGTAWTASSKSRTLYTSGTKTVDSGQTYRLKATITCYTSSGSATATVYS